MGDRARPAGPDEKLMRAWINERCAPTLLPYAVDVVTLVQGRMHRVEQHMMEKADDEQFQKWATYHALELDRIKFLLKSYLRCRLVKIQMYAFHICANQDMIERLSPSENEFARSLRDAYVLITPLQSDDVTPRAGTLPPCRAAFSLVLSGKI
jgi:hypothetical protein